MGRIPFTILMLLVPVLLPAQPTSADFQPVADLLRDSVNVIGGFTGHVGLIVAIDGSVVFEWEAVPDALERSVPIASASKWLSGAAILSLVQDGRLSLDTRVDSLIPTFSGSKGEITLRQLFSHTSGLPGSSDYHTDRDLTLAGAVDSIGEQVELVSPPGAAFIYGGTSMQVAGRMAEIVDGRPWADLFQARVADPLGMSDTDYNGLGRTDNPQIGGGARSSARDYLKFLQAVASHGASVGGTDFLDSSSVSTMLADQRNGAVVIYSPVEAYGYLDSALTNSGYGFGLWREVTTYGAGSQLDFQSQGAFGFSPWIDPDRGITAVLSVTSGLQTVEPTYLRLKELIRQIVDGQSDVTTMPRAGHLDLN